MVCEHAWIEDELFGCGAVKMFYGDIGDVHEETRMVCHKCGAVDYIKK
jgi:hypothetical protein